jgi:hypothetical protein
MRTRARSGAACATVTVSLATAPEPGSACSAKTLEDNSAALPNLWGSLGVFQGNLYQREQDGRTVYSTRDLPGSTRVQRFTVATPAASPAHAGLGAVGAPRTTSFAASSVAAAHSTGVDEAWLRAIAHAESYYGRRCRVEQRREGSDAADAGRHRHYGVKDPFSAKQSILAGARHLKVLKSSTAATMSLRQRHTTQVSVPSRSMAV